MMENISYQFNYSDAINLINSTDNENVTDYSRDEDLAKVEIIVQSVIFVLAVLGNGTVLGFLLLKPRPLTRMHMLMIHLSVADLFVAFGSVLPQLAWDITFVFKGGDILCRLVKYMQTLAIYASSYVLVMTAIDRYIAICHPFVSRKFSSRIVQKMVIIAWALSFLFSIPQMFIFSYQMTPYGQYDCWATFEPEWTLTLYITIFTVLVYIIPTAILVFCYANICISVWKSNRVGEKISRLSKRVRPTSKHCERQSQQSEASRNSETLETSQDIYFTEGRLTSAVSNDSIDIPIKRKRRKHHSGITRAKLKTIKLTLTVILCYFLCWSPFFVAQMWAVYDVTAPFYGAAYTIILLLASLNSCTNPWIYLIFTDSVLDELKQCFTKIWR